jgi:cephalosporin hydroxylase
MPTGRQAPTRLALPTAVSLPLDATIRELWFARTRQHFEDSYAGIRMLQFPEDLRVFEHLLWLSRPNVVIEIGVQFGGSALWFRDRLRTLQQYGRRGLDEEVRVVAIDIDISAAAGALAAADPGFAQTITLLEGDVLDPSLPDSVAEVIPSNARCMVVEDSAHTYDTTRAALDGFARFVAPGGFLVIEDGCVDIESMRTDPGWPRGVLPAVSDWLASAAGADFVVRRDLEIYGITCHPQGFLQRTAA